MNHEDFINKLRESYKYKDLIEETTVSLNDKSPEEREYLNSVIDSHILTNRNKVQDNLKLYCDRLNSNWGK